MAGRRLIGGFASFMLLAVTASACGATTGEERAKATEEPKAAAAEQAEVAATEEVGENIASASAVPIPRPAPAARNRASAYAPRGGKGTAACKHIAFVRVIGFCTVENGCAKGKAGHYIYQAHIRNDSDVKQYIAYHFNRPDGAYIKGGMALEPRTDAARPIGLGSTPMPTEPDVASARRIRVTECGSDERIRFRWNANG